MNGKLKLTLQLLVAEVQAFFGDGAMSLHTRSLKYGKLRNGQLVVIPPHLIRRLKSHFHHLPPPCGPRGVDVIIGLNGMIWVSQGSVTDQENDNKASGSAPGSVAPTTTTASTANSDGLDAEGVYSNVNDVS
jgi:exosome complex component RRP4